ARAVSPEEGDDAALGDPEGHPLQHEDHVVVDHLDAVDGEERPRGVAHGVDYFSLEQSRIVYPSFFPSSTAAVSSLGRTTSRIGVIQSETIVHFLPSHCWISTGPLPSWSSHVTLTGCVKPFNPIWSRRASVTFRCSYPSGPARR